MKTKKIFSVLISAVMAVSATISMISFTSSAEEGVPNTAAFDDLNQEEITTAMGASWNLGNQFDAYSNGKGNETAWSNPTVKKELIEAVKNAGFKSIRIPVTYMGRIGPSTTYEIDAEWLDRIKEVVEWCIECDLYVIINIHHDGNGDSNNGAWLDCSASDQNTIVDKFKACWKQIAEKFADYDEHLIFESMNEVGASGNPTQAVYENINNYNQVFVDTVRETSDNNAKRWLLVPGWYTNIDNTVGDYGFKVPTDENRDPSIPENEKRIMISVHYYDPWFFCGDNTDTAYSQWGKDGNPDKKNDTWADEEYMEGQVKKVSDKFVQAGYPVVIGEYGCINKAYADPANTLFRAYYCKNMCELSKKYGCIPVYWDNGAPSNSFGLFNRNTCKIEFPEIIDAMMEVYLTPKENVERYIDKVSALDGESYTAETWDAINTALNSAQELISSGTATDEQLLEAYNALNSAYFNLMPSNSQHTYHHFERVEKVESEHIVDGYTRYKCTACGLVYTDTIKAEGHTWGNWTLVNKATCTENGSMERICKNEECHEKEIKILYASGHIFDSGFCTICGAKDPSYVFPTTGTQPKTSSNTRSAEQVKKDKKNAENIINHAKIKKLTVISKEKKKITVKWNKASKVTGYIIQVSDNKKFKKPIAKKTLKKNAKKVTIKIKKLKKGKTYWVRVRAYKNYKSNGKTNIVKGSWKKVKFKVNLRTKPTE